MAAAAGEPLKEQVKRGVDELRKSMIGLRRDGSTPRASADLGPAQFRTTAMTVPYYVNEHQSVPESLRRGAIFEHRPGCGGQWRRTRPAVHSRRMNVGGNIGFQAVSN